jgi:hypothetical protein
MARSAPASVAAHPALARPVPRCPLGGVQTKRRHENPSRRSGKVPGRLPEIPLDEWLALHPRAPLPAHLSEDEEVTWWRWENPWISPEHLRAQGATLGQIARYRWDYSYREDLVRRRCAGRPEDRELYIESMNFKATLQARGEPLPRPWSETRPDDQQLAHWLYTSEEARLLIPAMQADGMSYEEIQERCTRGARR